MYQFHLKIYKTTILLLRAQCLYCSNERKKTAFEMFVFFSFVEMKSCYLRRHTNEWAQLVQSLCAVCTLLFSFWIFRSGVFFSELPKVFDFFMHFPSKQPSYFDIVEFVSLFYIQCISGISLAFIFSVWVVCDCFKFKLKLTCCRLKNYFPHGICHRKWDFQHSQSHQLHHLSFKCAMCMKAAELW